jgi:transcriptional regulator with XRE-family HTH domain
MIGTFQANSMERMDEHRAESIEDAAIANRDVQHRLNVVPEIDGVIPVPEPIEIYRRGHPLPQDLRARVMLYLQQGLSKQTIANRLCISRSTVSRYQKAAAEQNKAVPNVRPWGGYRSSAALLNRQQILQLGEMLLRQPKLTIRELKQFAVDAAVLGPDKVPSDTTIWNSKAELRFLESGLRRSQGLETTCRCK